MMIKRMSPKLLKSIILVGITVSSFLLLATPLIMTATFKTMVSSTQLSIIVVVTSAFIYFCALPYMVALFNLKKLCQLIIEKVPFTAQTVKILRIISYCSFSEMLIFIVGTILITQNVAYFQGALIIPPILIVSFICLVLGLSFLVLSQLFKHATDIKEENDQTI